MSRSEDEGQASVLNILSVWEFPCIFKYYKKQTFSWVLNRVYNIKVIYNMVVDINMLHDLIIVRLCDKGLAQSDIYVALLYWIIYYIILYYFKIDSSIWLRRIINFSCDREFKHQQLDTQHAYSYLLVLWLDLLSSFNLWTHIIMFSIIFISITTGIRKIILSRYTGRSQHDWSWI